MQRGNNSRMTTRSRARGSIPDSPEQQQVNEGEKKGVAPLPYAELPAWEAWLYIAGWSTATLYSGYAVYVASIEHEVELNRYDFSPGWAFTGRKKDISNFEWNFWYTWSWTILPWMAGHVLLGQLLRRTMFERRQYVMLAYALVALTQVMSIPMLSLILGHCLVIYVTALLSSSLIVWFVALGLLSTLNYGIFTSWMKSLCHDDPYEKKFYLLVLSLALVNLRYISFALELVKQRRQLKQNHQQVQESSGVQDLRKNEGTKSNPMVSSAETKVYGLIDMLVYVFYLPLFFTGPTITFDQFYSQLHRPLEPFTKQSLLSLLKDTCHVLFWCIFMEACLHFLYYNAIQHNNILMQKLPLWALAGVGFYHGQFFMVKYVVLFGLPGSMARLDQFDPPKGPKCIARIYLYSKMWRYFDRGLYAFLKRHIYVPVGGSQHGLLRRLLASFCCFFFVYIWHGAEDYLLWWTLLNFVGISLESLGFLLAANSTYQTFEEQWLTPTMARRLKAAASVPLLAMSAIAIFYFFGGKDIGHLFYDRLILEGWPVSTLTVFICLYCCVQSSMEADNWEVRKAKMD